MRERPCRVKKRTIITATGLKRPQKRLDRSVIDSKIDAMLRCSPLAMWRSVSQQKKEGVLLTRGSGVLCAYSHPDARSLGARHNPSKCPLLCVLPLLLSPSLPGASNEESHLDSPHAETLAHIPFHTGLPASLSGPWQAQARSISPRQVEMFSSACCHIMREHYLVYHRTMNVFPLVTWRTDRVIALRSASSPSRTPPSSRTLRDDPGS